jgi:hypothetical protein
VSCSLLALCPIQFPAIALYATLLSGIPTSKEVASKIRYFYREYSSFNWTKNEIPPNSPSYYDIMNRYSCRTPAYHIILSII